MICLNFVLCRSLKTINNRKTKYKALSTKTNQICKNLLKYVFAVRFLRRC